MDSVAFRIKFMRLCHNLYPVLSVANLLACYPQAVIFSDCVACAHAHAYLLTYNNLLTKNQPITVPLLLSESLGM